MAECKLPVRIDGYKCVEDMVQEVLNYTYKGKTLKEWADSISEPQTNADRIRAMTDEELAKWLDGGFRNADWCDISKFPNGDCMGVPCLGCIIDWLKQEVDDGQIHRPLH